MSSSPCQNASPVDSQDSIPVIRPLSLPRTRDTRGRYKSRRPNNERRTQRAQQQRDSERKRTALKRVLFEKFLHSFCLKGSSRDFLPAARSNGPLVEIFERLLNARYILGRPERYTRTRGFYKDGGHPPRR